MKGWEFRILAIRVDDSAADPVRRRRPLIAAGFEITDEEALAVGDSPKFSKRMLIAGRKLGLAALKHVRGDEPA